MDKERLEFLDFAKGFAMLVIVLFHYSQPYALGIWAKIILVGGSGVHLFFILSGFGLGLSQRKIGIFEFYLKRASKILVPYFLIILIIFCMSLVLPLYQDTGLYALFGHLFFYKMFDENIITSFGYHFWFMSTIIQFYIVYPMISIIKGRVGMFSFAFGSLFVSVSYWVVISYYGVAEQRVFNSFFLQYLWEFNLGIVLATLYREKGFRLWEQNILMLIGIAIVSFSVMATMALTGGRLGQTFNDVPSLAGISALAAFVFAICRGHLLWIKKSIVWVGRFSYEWYLTHMVVYLLVVLFLSSVLHVELNIFISFFLILPISIGVAFFFMLFILKLAMHWQNVTRTSRGH